MAIIEVNENQKQILLEHLQALNWQLKTCGPYGSRTQEMDRIKDLEDIRDLVNQMNSTL